MSTAADGKQGNLKTVMQNLKLELGLEVQTAEPAVPATDPVIRLSGHLQKGNA